MDFKIVQIPLPFAEPTNLIRIGDALLDTGHVDDASTAVLFQHLDDGDLKGVKQVIVTHPHVDHVSASAGVPRIGQIPHTVFKGGEQVIGNISEYLLKARQEQHWLLSKGDQTLLQMVESVGRAYFPAERQFGPVNITRFVGPGDVINIGDVALKVFHTPGHETHHMALLHEASGTLFSGDLITNSGHFNRTPLTPDIGTYEVSLAKLLELNPKSIVPSHGTVISNGVEHLKKCQSNVQRIKGQILASLEKLREASHLDIAKDVFKTTDVSKAGTLSLSVWSYLMCLEGEGKIVLDREMQLAKPK